jgi:gamma-D-glutamyl-L-lysine dipeptidyl-peptidase
MQKKFSLIILLLIFSFLFQKCEKNNMTQINSILENVKNNFAPDKRVAIFNVEADYKNGKIVISGETNLTEASKNLEEQLKSINIDFVNNINILPDSSLGDKKYGIINLSVANIRSKPEHSAELATQGLLGTIVNVLKECNDWYLIQTPDKYISWIDEGGIQLVNINQAENWKKEDKVIIVANNSTLYKDPSCTSEIISDLVLGDLLKLDEMKNGFAKVEFPDERTGFVKVEDVKEFNKWIVDSVITASSVISSAKRLVGLPYLWGGTSSKGVDCSGFTKTIFFMNGVILPRDASQQVNVGELVNTDSNFESLIPGDLLFFGRKKTNTEQEKIIHVALYIGNGEYIHSSGRVRYNSLDVNSEDFNKYRFDSFVKAKRIIGVFDKGENLVRNNTFYN